MNFPTDENELDDLIEDNPDMTEDLAQLLDEHDYDVPSVGDIRQGTIVSISSQGMIIDLGLKRDGLVQPSDLDDLEPEVRESLKVDDEIPIYIMETNQPDRLISSLRINPEWKYSFEATTNTECVPVNYGCFILRGRDPWIFRKTMGIIDHRLRIVEIDQVSGVAIHLEVTVIEIDRIIVHGIHCHLLYFELFLFVIP